MKKPIKEIAKQLAPNWLVLCARWILSQYRYRKSRKFIEKLLETENNIYLEIGAEKKRSGWYTLDKNLDCDICWDLRNGLPFPDNSIQRMYSSHVLEHFSYSDLINLLEECLRVLAPNGTFSVSVPNARIYISAYINDEDLNSNQYFKYKSALHGNCKIDYVNYIAFMDGHHKYMFDKENLLSILRNVGYSSYELRDFDTELDVEERRFESIYAVAKK